MTVPSFFQVDPSRGEPLYQQLADAVARAVAAGALVAGDALPSVREVAVALCINLNTVSKAYRRLQDQGLAELQRGVGVFVAGNSAPASAPARLELLRDRLAALADEARQLGLGEEQVIEGLRRELRAPSTRSQDATESKP